MALRQFIKEGFRPPAILFTETKERCQRIMGELLYDGINAMSLCAAKSPAERQKVIQATRLGLDQILDELYVTIGIDPIQIGPFF